jgi:hypothetical protein
VFGHPESLDNCASGQCQLTYSVYPSSVGIMPALCCRMMNSPSSYETQWITTHFLPLGRSLVPSAKQMQQISPSGMIMPGLVRSKSGSRAPPGNQIRSHAGIQGCGRQAVAAPGQWFSLSATVADRQWQRPVFVVGHSGRQAVAPPGQRSPLSASVADIEGLAK